MEAGEQPLLNQQNQGGQPGGQENGDDAPVDVVAKPNDTKFFVHSSINNLFYGIFLIIFSIIRYKIGNSDNTGDNPGTRRPDNSSNPDSIIEYGVNTKLADLFITIPAVLYTAFTLLFLLKQLGVNFNKLDGIDNKVFRNIANFVMMAWGLLYMIFNIQAPNPENVDTNADISSRIAFGDLRMIGPTLAGLGLFSVATETVYNIATSCKKLGSGSGSGSE